jgi:hypothetical protein
MFVQTSIHQVGWFALVVVSLSVAAGCGEPAASVIIDNGGGRATMTVAVDGQQLATIPSGDFDSIFLPPGQHQFEIKIGGQCIFSGAKILAPSDTWGVGRRYVFNPPGNQRYAVCKVVYGNTLMTDTMEGAFVKFAEQYKGEKVDPTRMHYVKMKRYAEPMPPTAWFELPLGVAYVLSGPPEYVYSKSGSDSRRVLTRISPGDHSQLKRNHAIEQPTEKDLVNLAGVTERVLDTLGNLKPAS